jgi:acetolactate synthase-1/2/3 large subunit
MLSVPKDLWDEYAGPESEVLPPAIFAPAASELAVNVVARRIANAQRPIMLVGGQVRSTEACAALVAAAERWHCPVVTSPNGRGAISEDHALCLGHAGRFGQRQASQALQEADLVIALGCQVNDLTTHNWSLLSIQVPMVQVNQDGATIGRNWPAAEAIVADPGKFLSSLAGLVPSSDYLGNVWSVADKKRERQQARQTYYSIHDDEKVKPQSVMGELEKVLPDTHTIVMGGGRFQQFVGEWLVRSRKSFFYAANSGTVGYALSGSIGAALASPDRTVVCCLGDGDFMMHPQELETAVRSGIRLKIVVFNDFAFGAMKARQRIPYGTEYTNPDIALLASAFNVSGRTLVRGSETAEAVRWLIKQPKVAILDVQMDLKENRSLMYGHDIGDKV